MEGFFNYIVIEDGVPVAIGSGGGSGGIEFRDEGISQGSAAIMNVVGAGAGVSISGGVATLNVGGASGTIEVQNDGVKDGDASILDFIGNGVKTAFAAGKSSLEFPEIPLDVLMVHPSFTDDNDLQQYSTVEAAITRAKAIRNPGSREVLIWVRTAIYQPTARWDLHDGYGMVFDPMVSFDFSSWAGGTTFIQFAGNTTLKGVDLTYGAIGSHPFTGGNHVECLRADPVTGSPTIGWLENTWIWDTQGGATYGIRLTSGGGSLPFTPVLVARNNLVSVITSVGGLVQEGDWEVRVEGGASIFTTVGASAIKQVDVGSDYPDTSISIMRIQALGGAGVYDFEKSTNGTIEMNGSILRLANTNINWLTDIAGTADGPINSEQILQFEYPDPSLSVSERYSLKSALNLIDQDIHDTTQGHDHDGVGSKRVDYDDLVNQPEFGTEYDSAEDDTESNTTSTTFQQKLILTTGSLPVGTYRIGYYCEFKSDDGDNDGAEAQVDLDAGTIIAQADVQNARPSFLGTAQGMWTVLGGVKEVTFGSATTHTIEIDYRQTNSNTARIRRARIEIWRIS